MSEEFNIGEDEDGVTIPSETPRQDDPMSADEIIKQARIN